METLLCPYPGLRPFDEKESIFFKGRDTNIDEIIKQIEQKRFVMITGASGDGKSSIVYAGVIPNIKAGFIKATYNAWRFSIIKPEDKPLLNLSASLAEIFNLSSDKVYEDLSYGFSSIVELYKNSEYYINNESKDWQDLSLEGKKARRTKAANLFILVDQFEEFFTNTENFYNNEPTPEAEIAINLLTETVRVANEQKLPIYIVFTMRSDFIGNSSAFRGLPELVGFSHFFIPRLKREEIEKIILEPALLNGDSISEQLVNYMTSAAADGADQLPIIQHALNRIWNIARVNNEEMDLIHLAMAGGIDPLELSENDRARFKDFFSNLPEHKKEHYLHPSLQNVINAHADELFADTIIEFKQNTNGAIDDETIQLALKRCFQTLTKIDEGRSVRHRTSVKDVLGNINNPSIGLKEINFLLRKYREQGNTLINPFVTQVAELTDDSVIDITHEALIRNWKKLHEWVEEDEQHLNDYIDFNKQLIRWEENNKSSRFLLSLGPLEQFEKWHKNSFINEYWLVKYDESIDSNEEKFTKAKTKIASIISYLKESRKELTKIESAKKRRNRILLAASAVAILVLSVLTGWAVKQKNLATEQTQLAEQKRTEAETSKTRMALAFKQAEKAKGEAMQNEQNAMNAKEEADKFAKVAMVQKNIAEQATVLAQTKSAYANEQAERANTEMTNAMTQKTIADEQKEKAMSSEAKTKTLSLKAISQQMAYYSTDNKFRGSDTLAALFAMHAWDLHKEANGEVNDPVIYNGLIQANYLLRGKDCFNFKGRTFFEQSIIFGANDSMIFSAGNNEGGVVYKWSKLTGTQKASNISCDKAEDVFLYNFFKAENAFVDPKSNSFFKESKNGIVTECSSKGEQIKIEHQFENFGGIMRGAMSINDGEKFMLVSKAGKVFIYNNKDKAPEKITNIGEEVLSFAALNKTTGLVGTVKGLIYQVNLDGEISYLESSRYLPYSIETSKTGNLVLVGDAYGGVSKYDYRENKLHNPIGWNVCKTIIKKISYNEKSDVWAVISADKNIWVNRKQSSLVYLSFTNNIRSVYVDDNGDVFAGLSDGTFRMFHSDCNIIYNELCSYIKRDLTKAEWNKYGGRDVEFKPLNCKK